MKKFQGQTRSAFTSGPLFLCVIDHDNFSDLEERREILLALRPGGGTPAPPAPPAAAPGAMPGWMQHTPTGDIALQGSLRKA